MLALLCGGQGRLSPEMFDLVSDCAQAGAIFDAAGTLLGHDPRALVRADNDMSEENRTNQILSVTAALAVHACIADILPDQFAVTGYSVGEMAAWSIAGIWPTAAALRLTDLRARAMDAANGNGGRLCYVRGLGRQTVESLATDHRCAIAIINPGDMFVVGGSQSDVKDLCRDAEEAGAARAALLNVRIASHTQWLADAIPAFRAALDETPAAAPRALLLAGGSGTRVFSPANAKAGLAAQVASVIDWAATLEALGESGVDRVLDLGPGHALSDITRTAHPAIKSHAADSFRSIQGLRDWIAAD